MTPNPRAFGYPVDLINDYKQEISEENLAHVKSVKSASLMDRQERIRLLYTNGVDSHVTDVEFWIKEIGWVNVLFDLSTNLNFRSSTEKI